jgi:hypothetical protein
MRNHVACQTDESVLPDLREMQAKLDESRGMLAEVTHALGHMESQIRRDIRQEYEKRVNTQNVRLGEKVSYLRKRAELQVSAVRAAARIEHADAMSSFTGIAQQQVDTLQRQKDACAKQAREAVTQASKSKKLQAMLQDDNIRLTAQLEQIRSGREAREPQQSDSAVVTKLEAALAARERTIESLREQLAMALRAKGEKSVGSSRPSSKQR